MKMLYIASIWLLAAMGYADGSNVVERLTAVDEQIENVVRQKVQLKQEIAEHQQRGDSTIRPRVERRQEMEIEPLMQNLQALNAQLQQLESQRSQILLSLD